MERRALAEDGVEGRGIRRRDPGGVQVAEPALELDGAAERLLDGHLLIEREPDQQGERFLDEQAVGVVIAGERQAIDRGSAMRAMVVGADLPFAGQADRPSSVQRFGTDVGWRGGVRGCQPVDRARSDRSGTHGKETEMASTPMVRADVYGLLPSLLILLMLILASLGIVAHAATL